MQFENYFGTRDIAEDLALVPGTHLVAQPSISAVPRDPMLSSKLFLEAGMPVVNLDMCEQNIHICKNKPKIGLNAPNKAT